MKQTAKEVRDLLVWKVQVLTPQNATRRQHLEILGGVVSGKAEEQMGKVVFSHYLHAHAKIVGHYFPWVFMSNAKEEGIRRKGARPPRNRKGSCSQVLEQPSVQVPQVTARLSRT